jgi:hypothetical protein
MPRNVRRLRKCEFAPLNHVPVGCTNREYENINNIKLIGNNLQHINCELDSNEPSPMRLAKESYQLLLRMMVEALRGTANRAIVVRKTENKEHWYKHGDDPWKVIRPGKVQGCEKAWRYSVPVLESPPPGKKKEASAAPPPEKEYLLHFYELLARIQTPCFMLRYTRSAVVSVSDAQMQLLEWLHEEIRNVFEHFIPEIRLVPSDYCLHASETCLQLAFDLLTRSNNVISHGIDDLETKLYSALISISAFRAKLTEVKNT